MNKSTQKKSKKRYRINEKFVELPLTKVKFIRKHSDKVLNCDHRQLYYDLQGYRAIPAERLLKWAELLGVEPKELLEPSEEDNTIEKINFNLNE